MMKKRIGLMGGTFNPVHHGHLLLAQEAKEQYMLDEIWFLPAKRPPHKEKEEITADSIRLEMLKLVIEENPSFFISLIEIQRKKQLTYTYDTMEQLKEMYPEYYFYFIIGEDSLQYLHKWYRYDELLRGMAFLVAPRSGKQTKHAQMDTLMDTYRKTYHADIGKIEMPLIEISSTDIREKIKQGKSVKYYLPDCVEEFINAHELYR